MNNMYLNILNNLYQKDAISVFVYNRALEIIKKNHTDLV